MGGASPFHMRRHTPLDRCNNVTRPKSSVTAASKLQGDSTIDSPWRRESGSPNLEGSGAEVKQVTQNRIGGGRAEYVAYLMARGVAGSTLGFCFCTDSSSVLGLFHPSQPLSEKEGEREERNRAVREVRQVRERKRTVGLSHTCAHTIQGRGSEASDYLAALRRADVSLVATARAT